MVMTGKAQLHVCRLICRCLQRAQHRRQSRAAAGLPIQREHDGIKDHRLARAGAAADQIQRTTRESCKIDQGPMSIGSEPAHLQLQWSHASPSSLASSKARRQSRCLSLSGWLFCSAYSSAMSSMAPRSFTLLSTCCCSDVRILSYSSSMICG